MHEGFDPTVGPQLWQGCQADAGEHQGRERTFGRMEKDGPRGRLEITIRRSDELADDPQHTVPRRKKGLTRA
ncbi:hypothetical protein [Azospirillum griseum]|uniref:hypothetical protein n=1 Tax=Azospirillum griseum TaxID=2496639 RepID=UPI001315335A|nr:hypothetical protein [Azospirillum griseum]